MCPGLDSNQHACYSATPSRWCVYQFHHLGNKSSKLAGEIVISKHQAIDYECEIYIR